MRTSPERGVLRGEIPKRFHARTGHSPAPLDTKRSSDFYRLVCTDTLVVNPKVAYESGLQDLISRLSDLNTRGNPKSLDEATNPERFYGEKSSGSAHRDIRVQAGARCWISSSNSLFDVADHRIQDYRYDTHDQCSHKGSPEAVHVKPDVKPIHRDRGSQQ